MNFSELSGNRGWVDVANTDPIATCLIRFLKHKEYQPFVYELRASMLPFCPRMYSLAAVLKKEELPSLIFTFMDDAILSIGSTAHTIMQKWFGRSGVLVGRWQCSFCHSEKGPLVKGPVYCSNERCLHHGSLMSYCELDLRHKKTGLTAHPDGLFYTPSKSLEGLEFKTISQTGLDELKEPFESHWKYQAATYAYLLKDNFNRNVRYFSFIYIARNLPSSFEVLYSRRQGNGSEIVAKSYGGKFTLAKIFRRKMDISSIKEEFVKISRTIELQKRNPRRLISTGLCKTEAEGANCFCPLIKECFSRHIARKYGSCKE